MTFDRYFREELSFLKEQGRHYSELRPHLAQFLNAKYKDPDVERLLEGFAYLTSRLRHKIDDDFPELTHSIINMLWPNFLRPVPSTTIVQFKPVLNIITQQQILKKGLQLSSEIIDESEIHCEFRTCRDLKIYPLERIDLDVKGSRKTSFIELEFQTQGEIALKDIQLNELDLFLGKNSYETQTLYLWMSNFLKSIKLLVNDSVYTLPLENIQSIGWSEKDSILPYPNNVYEGYRILHEYLSYPDSFMFMRLQKLDHYLRDVLGQNFKLQFEFTRPLPEDLRLSKNKHLMLYCVPAINLFEHSAEPIELDGKKNEYRISLSNRQPKYYEVFNIEDVHGWNKEFEGRKRGDGRRYPPFESFQHELEHIDERSMVYYRMRAKESSLTDGFDYFISFMRADEVAQIGEHETISINLTCSNRFMPLELGIGDINECMRNEPEFVSVQNITEPTMPLHPLLDGSLLWTLISNFTLNYFSLLSTDSIKTIIKAYDFKAYVDRQTERISSLRIEEGIIDIKTKPLDRIFKGMPIRGLESTIYLNEEAFASEGDLYLFAKVLSRFFALFAAVNSFHHLIAVNTTSNEIYSFETEVGERAII